MASDYVNVKFSNTGLKKKAILLMTHKRCNAAVSTPLRSHMVCLNKHFLTYNVLSCNHIKTVAEVCSVFINM